LSDRTQVILAGLPRLLEEIVAAAVAAEHDLVLTDSVREIRSLSQGSRVIYADVVITGENEPGAISPLLERHPRLKVLAVTQNGESSWLYELRPVLLPLGPLSPSSLVTAVRALAEPVFAGCEP
jgi:hypothetical protein